MGLYLLVRGKGIAAASMLFAVAVVLHGDAPVSNAGILLPQEVGFDANDLERALSEDGTAGAATSSRGRESQSWPPRENDKEQNPLGLLNSPLPMGNSSPSSSSSSAGGAVGSGIVLCLFNSTIAIADDAPLGRLAEDHGLSLPDPPGTNLLRPPRGFA